MDVVRRAPTRESETRGDSRRFVLVLVAIAALAFGVRVWFALAVTDTYPFGAPVGVDLVGDARTYHELAARLAAGLGYVNADGSPTAEFPPLYPFVLSLAHRIGATSPDSHRVLGAAFGAGTVVVIGLIGRRLAGRTVGVVAAVLAALYLPLVELDTSHVAEGLYVLLVAAALLGVYESMARPTWWRWLAVGVVFGLAALTRSEALLLAPVVVAPVALRRLEPRPRAGLAALGLVAVGAMCVVGPWLVRDLQAMGELVPVSGNGATLIAGSNCDAVFDGRFAGTWRIDCIDTTGPPGESETERFARYRSDGTDYLRSHLGELPRVGAIRVARTFGMYHVEDHLAWEVLEGRNLATHRAAHRVYIVVAMLAVAGFVLGVRRRMMWWPMAAPIVTVAIVSVLTYGNQRFRAAAEPSLVVFGAVALSAAGAEIGRRWSARGAERSDVRSEGAAKLHSREPRASTGDADRR